MTPEGKLKEEVKKHLKSLGGVCWFFMPVPFGYGVRGVPDFVGCYRGKFFAIETKAPSGKATKFQDLCRRAIVEAGGKSIVADSMEPIINMFWSL